MNQKSKHMFGHTLLRVTIGLMLLLAGINKIKGPDNVVGMLTNLGFPAPTVFAWILILSEIIFGALVLIGWKVRYTTWPLAIILAVAWLTVVIPNSGISSNNSFFHLIAVAGLITIALTGPGKWAISRTHS
jgi:putative oxidoreductase